MSSRDGLVELLSSALSDIHRKQSSYISTSSSLKISTVDANLLAAVADYIEVGKGGDSTLNHLRDTLTNNNNNIKTESDTSYIKKSEELESSSSTNLNIESKLGHEREEEFSFIRTPEELGQIRAQKLLAQALSSRYS